MVVIDSSYCPSAELCPLVQSLYRRRKQRYVAERVEDREEIMICRHKKLDRRKLVKGAIASGAALAVMPIFAPAVRAAKT
jgi:hypothetical protein